MVYIGPAVPDAIMAVRKARLERQQPGSLVDHAIKSGTNSKLENSINGDESDQQLVSKPTDTDVQIGPFIPHKIPAESSAIEDMELISNDHKHKAETEQDDNESSSDSDDGYGPSLPTQSASIEEEEQQALERLEQFKETDDNLAKVKGNPLRDEWMYLAPKELKDAFSDNKKTRGNSKRGKDDDDIDDSWMETNAQTKKRLADEMMGLVSKSSSNSRHETVTRGSTQDLKKLKQADSDQFTVGPVDTRPSMLDEHLQNKGTDGSRTLNDMVMRAQGISTWKINPITSLSCVPY